MGTLEEEEVVGSEVVEEASEEAVEEDHLQDLVVVRPLVSETLLEARPVSFFHISS